MDETARGDFHGKRSSWSSHISCHFLFLISCICSLAFGYFVHFSIFLFNATARQKTCCNVMLFPGNQDSLTLRGHVVPLDGGFISQDNILAWCKLIYMYQSWQATILSLILEYPHLEWIYRVCRFEGFLRNFATTFQG